MRFQNKISVRRFSLARSIMLLVRSGKRREGTKSPLFTDGGNTARATNLQMASAPTASGVAIWPSLTSSALGVLSAWYALATSRSACLEVL